MSSPDVSSIRLWSPERREMLGILRDETAVCLAAAFGSRVWSRTPMPVGPAHDTDSALGILAQLHWRGRFLLATVDEPGDRQGSPVVLGCVLGAVLDEALLAA